LKLNEKKIQGQMLDGIINDCADYAMRHYFDVDMFAAFTSFGLGK
jgi:hypothetical protein